MKEYSCKTFLKLKWCKKQGVSPTFPQLVLGQFIFTEDLHLYGNGFKNGKNPLWICSAKIDTNVASATRQMADCQLSESRETYMYLGETNIKPLASPQRKNGREHSIWRGTNWEFSKSEKAIHRFKNIYEL